MHLDALLEAVNRHFFDGNRGDSNDTLLSTAFRGMHALRLFEGIEADAAVSPEVNIKADPVHWLLDAIAEQRAAEAPFFCLVNGEYGVGKTEFIHFLKDRMAEQTAHSAGPARALCVNLGPLRSSAVRGELIAKSVEDFLAFLLGSLGDGADVAVLHAAVLRGEVVLLLDGLDELIVTEAEHAAFFDNLDALLSAPASCAQVCLTTRVDYLPLWGALDASGALRVFKRAREGGVRTDFLRLMFLNEGLVRRYIRDRLEHPRLGARRKTRADARQVVECVSSNPDVERMLTRCLHLRIFCDVIEKLPADEIVEKLSRGDLASPTQLIGEFMNKAAQDLKQDQSHLTPFGWDLEKLFDVSLRLYQAGASTLQLEDARDIIADKPLSPNPRVSRHAIPDEEVLRTVHKCPFFVRKGHTLEYAHQIFFDYCVARAIAAQVRRDDFMAFGKTVFTVQMRHFVRDLVDEVVWYEANKDCFGLLADEDWSGPEVREGFVKVGKALLDFMTTPDRPPEDMRTSVQSFVEGCLDGSRKLNPRFRAFGFEAVAVWILRGRRVRFDRQLRGNFEECLRKSWAEAGVLLANTPADAKPTGWLLMIDQILDVSLRLRLRWPDTAVVDFVSSHADRWDAEPEIQQRIVGNAKRLGESVRAAA